MKKNTLKDGLDAKKDVKRDAKSSFCCSDIFWLECNEIFSAKITRDIKPWQYMILQELHNGEPDHEPFSQTDVKNF